jgi:hypothetical protein
MVSQYVVHHETVLRSLWRYITSQLFWLDRRFIEGAKHRLMDSLGSRKDPAVKIGGRPPGQRVEVKEEMQQQTEEDWDEQKKTHDEDKSEAYQPGLLNFRDKARSNAGLEGPKRGLVRLLGTLMQSRHGMLWMCGVAATVLQKGVGALLEVLPNSFIHRSCCLKFMPADSFSASFSL